MKATAVVRYLLSVLFAALLSPVALADALRVGLSADYPPLDYRQEGRLVGIEVDNARAVGEIIGRQMELVEIPFGRLIPALEAGEIDIIMSGMSVTQERSARVAFTEPFMQVGQMVIMHRDGAARFSQPWSIYREGVRIGVEPDTTGAAFAEKQLPDAEIHYYGDPEAAFAALRRKEVDLFIHDAPTSWRLANSAENADLLSTYTPLTEESIAWAVRPGDQALARELNRALGIMRSNGTLQYILNRWIPVRVEVH